MIQNKDIDSSGNNILEKQEGFLKTPSISVIGLEAGCDSGLLFYKFLC